MNLDQLDEINASSRSSFAEFCLSGNEELCLELESSAQVQLEVQ